MCTTEGVLTHLHRYIWSKNWAAVSLVRYTTYYIHRYKRWQWITFVDMHYIYLNWWIWRDCILRNTTRRMKFLFIFHEVIWLCREMQRRCTRSNCLLVVVVIYKADKHSECVERHHYYLDDMWSYTCFYTTTTMTIIGKLKFVVDNLL